MRKEHLAKLTPEQLARHRERHREAQKRYCAHMTPEQQARQREQHRMAQRRYHESRTDVQRARDCEAQQRRRANRTAEQRERDRQAAERYRASLTPDRRAALVAYFRQYRKKMLGAPKLSKPPLHVVSSSALCFSDALYAHIRKLVAVRDPDLRDDIIGAVYVGVLDGTYPLEVTAEHIKHARKQHFRMFDSFATVSLDAIIGDTGASRGQLMGIY